ncbi:MAG: tRNA epoxyqueuosine(34) reductase QueG [Bacteroidales bacterium]|nr:tRNA epoxyqueuosine(34) reductase QueG [Bacteroidales bacterium]
MIPKEQLSAFIKQEAASLGFAACGIAPSEKLDVDMQRLNAWLKKGFHAGMDYMQKHAELRANPELLVENAKSVIVFLYNYYPSKMMDENSPYLISSYAYGQDYHEVIREKLNILILKLKEQVPEISIRGFVDSAPVLERAWATRAGLGWIGKNSMLISRRNGSYFFISELITDLELEYDRPMGGNYCGDCSRCIDACPTGAITALKTVDANKCISYLTIENKEEISETFRGKYDQWIFGCDICQQVCPWNKYSSPHNEPAFEPPPSLMEMEKEDWEKLDNDQYKILFKKSAIKRAKFAGLKRNIEFLSGAD